MAKDTPLIAQDDLLTAGPGLYRVQTPRGEALTARIVDAHATVPTTDAYRTMRPDGCVILTRWRYPQ